MSSPQLLSNRYELGDTLGYGGMSEVHQGRDVRLGRDVAVKVLRADLARDPQFQERFRREAQNAAALNHPAIVAVYDTGEAETEYGKLPYIVMEYVDGRTLRDIVKGDGPMPGKRAMEVMADVSAALDFSHRNGIVHRDVKPANVMITKNGAVKVMDFGIARALADGQAAVTQTAAVIGTAQYLSPEQARGEQVDARSDVYSAGCVLFELLTGEPPFTGDSPVAVAYQHVREDPKAPSHVNPDVAPELDAIVLKALAKNPANRYQSAAEMRADLVKVLSGARPSAPMVMTDEDRTSIMTGARPTSAMAGAAGDYDEDDYEADEERREGRRKAWKRVGLVALCLAVLAGAAWLTTSLLGGKSDKIAVPPLVGQTQQAATQSLYSKGLRPNIQDVFCETKVDGTPGPCTKEQIGQVIKTDPVEGTQVPPTQTVTLSIGRAPRAVTVPSLTGSTPQDAKQKLNGMGIQVPDPDPSKAVETSDPNLVGKVVKTDPPDGAKITRGDKVNLLIGKKAPTVTLSDFKGQSCNDASANIKRLNLEVTCQPVDSSEPKDTVIDQSPGAGEVKPGTMVTLKVSKENQFTMPDITGKTPDEAKAILAKEKWTGSFSSKPKPVTDPSQDGKIISSSPASGSSATKDQTINLVVGKMSGSSPSSGSATPTPKPGGGGGGGGDNGGIIFPPPGG